MQHKVHRQIRTKPVAQVPAHRRARWGRLTRRRVPAQALADHGRVRAAQPRAVARLELQERAATARAALPGRAAGPAVRLRRAARMSRKYGAPGAAREPLKVDSAQRDARMEKGRRGALSVCSIHATLLAWSQFPVIPSFAEHRGFAACLWFQCHSPNLRPYRCSLPGCLRPRR
jgi:hypothetical protein